MSLLEMMFDDPRILLALAAALAPLVMALLLGVMLQMRRAMQRQAARRAEQEASALALFGTAETPDAPDDEALYGEAPPILVSEGDPSSAAEDEVGPEGEDGAPASAMQALLNSVFTDEEVINPLAHLLDEMDDIQATDLAALCERVASQLG